MKKIMAAILTVIIALGAVLVFMYVNNSEKGADYQSVVLVEYGYVRMEDLEKEADLVVLGTYLRDTRFYLHETNSAPITSGEVSVSKVLKGDEILKEISINFYGGTVPIDEFIKIQNETVLKNMGLDKLSEKEKKLGTYSVVNEYGVIAEPNENYIIFLSYDKEQNLYFVLSDSYGMRAVNEKLEAYNPDTKEFESFEKINESEK